jgi:hypothetical protein
VTGYFIKENHLLPLTPHGGKDEDLPLVSFARALTAVMRSLLPN